MSVRQQSPKLQTLEKTEDGPKVENKPGSASGALSSSGSGASRASTGSRASSGSGASSGEHPASSTVAAAAAARMRPHSSGAERPPSVSRISSSGGMIKKSAKDFIFGKVVGEGSFSSVYLAKEVDTKREFAIKVLEKMHMVREKKTQYVMREKEVLGRLGKAKHPFFVDLYATFQDAHRLYFVLSFEPNGELLGFIRKLTTFDPDATRFYSAEIVQALEHLHGLGIIHRDLKPENILLSKNMHIRITDFGSARILNDKKDNNLDVPAPPPPPPPPANNLNPAAGMDVERKSSFVGTAQYVSPEVLGNKRVAISSDLWALGCIIYQLLSGQHPFGDGNEYHCFLAIMKAEYVFPEGFPEVAKDLVGKLLVLDSDGRLGCEALGGYPPLKAHPFFEGIVWETLHEQDPPKLLPYLPASDHNSENLWSNIPVDMAKPGFSDQHLALALELGLSTGGASGGGDEPDPAAVLSPVNDPNAIKPEDMTEEQRRMAVQRQARDNIYHRFVEGNLILKQGYLEKRKGLFARRRMFIMTEGPCLYYIDTGSMQLKGKVPWSRALRPEAKNFKIFFVHTPHRTYYLEDPTGFALHWVKKITEVWNRYYGPINPKKE